MLAGLGGPGWGGDAPAMPRAPRPCGLAPFQAASSCSVRGALASGSSGPWGWAWSPGRPVYQSGVGKGAGRPPSLARPHLAPSLLLNTPLYRSPHSEWAVRPVWHRVTCPAVGFEALQTLGGVKPCGTLGVSWPETPDGGLHPESAPCFLTGACGLLWRPGLWGTKR